MNRRAAGWLILGAGALLVLGGGGIFVYTERQKVAAALRAAFRRYGLPESWGEALGETETGLVPTLVNLTGGDLLRGGSYGATQISWKTAQAWGFRGTKEDLKDINTSADLTAQMVAAGFTGSTNLGRPETPEDMAAVWNAGRSFDDPALPAMTRNRYVPKLQANLRKIDLRDAQAAV